MGFKLYVPPEDEPEAIAARLKPVRKKHPRCRCGCGKAAFWPQDGSPVFHTRLCGYLMALEMFRKEAR